ncbi:MAG: hypothetical protein ACTS3F_02315 [Phycisphaerales bacterium]
MDAIGSEIRNQSHRLVLYCAIDRVACVAYMAFGAPVREHGTLELIDGLIDWAVTDLLPPFGLRIDDSIPAQCSIGIQLAGDALCSALVSGAGGLLASLASMVVPLDDPVASRLALENCGHDILRGE